MSDPFIGEIRAFAFDYAPVDWAVCAGQTIPVQQNSALFAVIGNSFGGDGSSIFMLPNLQGRTVIGGGSGPGLSPHCVGEQVGSRSQTLSLEQLPAHTHAINAEKNSGSKNSPAGAFWAKGAAGGAKPAPVNTYAPLPAGDVLAGSAVAQAGSGLLHENQQPWLTLNLCICLTGVFPVRS